MPTGVFGLFYTLMKWHHFTHYHQRLFQFFLIFSSIQGFSLFFNPEFASKDSVFYLISFILIYSNVSLVPLIIRCENNLKNAILHLLGIATMVSITGLILYFQSHHIRELVLAHFIPESVLFQNNILSKVDFDIYIGSVLRLNSTVPPFTFGILLLLGFSISAQFFINEKNGLKILLFFITTSLIVLAIVLSHTRSLLISLALSIILIISVNFMKNTWNERIRGFFIFGLIVFFSSVPISTPNDLTVFRSENYFQVIKTYDHGESNERRYLLLKAAAKMGMDHPWFGVGFGNFRAALLKDQRYTDIFPYLKSNYEPGVSNPHNLLMEIFATSGMIGLIFFLTGCFLFIKTIYNRMINNTLPESGKILFLSVLSLLPLSMFGVTFTESTVVYLLAYVSGLLSTMEKSEL